MIQDQRAIASDRILTPMGICPGAVLIRSGRIVDVVPSRSDIPPEFLVDDVGDLLVLPGMVDSHVHVNQPGRTHWEGFTSATRAAAAGGVTTLVDMPLNCSPVTTTRAALEVKLAEVTPLLWVDCGFWGGLVPDNCSDLTELLDGGVLGVKAFLADSGLEEFPMVERTHLEAALPQLAARKLPLLVHAELESCVAPKTPTGEERRYRHYLNSRPDAWEVAAIAMLIELAQRYRTRIHIVHLSSQQALGQIAAARKAGVPISAETCPHYLVLNAECVADGDTRFKCAPPIRAQANAELLWDALLQGTIDFVVSDHSPCSPELKHFDTGDFTRAWGGIASLQLALPLLWTEMDRRRIPPQQLLRWCCSEPARLAGLGKRKGQLAPGFDADVVVWDVEHHSTIAPEQLHFRHKLTPYAERAVRGQVVRTYVRGQLIFERGQFHGHPHGVAL